MLRCINLLFVLFSLVPISKTTAQNHVFKVFLTDGKVLFDKGDGKPKIKLKIGDAISYGTIIIIENQVLSLIHKNGNILELTSPGFYSCKALESKLLVKKPAPICNDLATVFYNTYLSKIRAAYSHHNSCNATTITFEFNSLNSNKIHSIVEDSTYTISWSIPLNIKEKATFRISVLNLFGDKLSTFTTNETVLDINQDFIQKHFSLEKNVFLEIINISDSNYLDDKITLSLQILNREKTLEYTESVKKLNKEFDCKNTLTGALLLAVVNEKYGFVRTSEEWYKLFFKKLNIKMSPIYLIGAKQNNEDEYGNLYLALKRIHSIQ